MFIIASIVIVKKISKSSCVPEKWMNKLQYFYVVGYCVTSTVKVNCD
jgi:hypothetical protein